MRRHGHQRRGNRREGRIHARERDVRHAFVHERGRTRSCRDTCSAFVCSTHSITKRRAPLLPPITHDGPDKRTDVIIDDRSSRDREHSFDRRIELEHRLITLVRIFLQTREQNALEFGGETRVFHAWRKNRSRDDVFHRHDVGFAKERMQARREAIQHDAHREDVRAAIDLFPQRLLGGHVRDFALELSCGRFSTGTTKSFGDAEVDHLHDAVVRDENVLR